MSGFYLVGDGWAGIENDRDAFSCILLKINAGGNLITLGSKDVEIYEIEDGRLLHFEGGIVNDPIHKESVDPFSRNLDIQSMKFSVLGEYFPFIEIRRSGIVLSDIEVDVYWHVSGEGHTLEQSFHLLRGKITGNTFNEEKNIVTLTVSDQRLTSAKVFPPAIATNADLDAGVMSLDNEFNGCVYPFIVGTVKKVPVLKMTDSTPGNDRYIIMLDTHNEFAAGAVTELYDGDAILTKVADGRTNDVRGVGYWYQTSSDSPDTKDFTADVTGHEPDTVDEVIAYLLRFFSDDPDIFDLTSLDNLKITFQNIVLGFVVNARVNDGALGIVRNRLSQLLPFSMIQRNAKYSFIPLIWDRNVVKHLSTERNIIRKASGPTETPRSNIYNSFVVKYGLSGFRGDYTGAVVRDFDNSEECDISKKRYGERVMPDVNAGDLADLASASWLITWLIETYSKNRVCISYICDLDVVDVQIWDTVSVEDLWEGWDHRPLFKVLAVYRGTGGTIQLDLISVDDYVDVYAVNQPIVEYTPVIAPDNIVLSDDLFAYYAMENNVLLGEDSTINSYDLDNINGMVQSNAVPVIQSWYAGTWNIGSHFIENGPPYIDAFNCGHITISTWVKVNNNVNHQTIASKGDQWRIHIQQNTGKIWFHITAGGLLGTCGVSTASVTSGVWEHVVITYDGIDMKLYINGVLDTDTPHPAGGDITIASDEILAICALRYAPSALGTFFWGSIDECGFWSRALTQSEITTLYNSGNGLSYAQIIAY